MNIARFTDEVDSASFVHARRESMLGTSTMQTTARRTTSMEVKNAVVEDLNGHTYLCTPQQFLNQFFPSRTQFQGILDGLGDHYDKSNRRWKIFPDKPGGKEAGYYTPFADLANAICIKAKTHHLTTEKSVQSVWVDRHSLAPKSINPNAAMNRPDIVNVIGDGADWRQLENVCHDILVGANFVSICASADG